MEAPFQSHNNEEFTSTTCSTNEKVVKFSFLAKILQDCSPKTSPENIMLRPVKFTRVSDRNQQQVSAKNIIKRAIIKQTSHRFEEKVRDNFLMKGKMLSGTKKPFQIQMNSFLLCLNERINREAQKNQKNSELPSLGKQEIQTAESTSTKKNYQDIFKNLKEMRLKRFEDNIQSPPSKLGFKIRQHSVLMERKEPSQTISYNTQQNRLSIHQTPSTIKIPLPIVKLKEISYKKGYLSYDLEAKEFLDKYYENMVSEFENVPEKTKQITANAYMVLDHIYLKPISGRNTKVQIQIASLSKIMTCYLSLLVCRKYNIDIYTSSFRVGDKAAQTPGTTAQLQNGDVLTVYQLLMGLMLPSGNDASVAIAEAMGKIIQRHKKKETKKTYYQTFIAHMNLLSKQLKLEQTWNNSSGLSFSPNFSSPQAIIILTSIAIRNPIFLKVVNIKSFEIDIKNERFGLNRRVIWKNTNKLLENGWQGVKTGTTENAGHCLMAKKDNLLISVFGCQSISRRFSECVRLFDKYQSYISS